MRLRTVYAALLRLYPGDHRELFAAEMLRVFDEAAAERRRRGWIVFVRFAIEELLGIVIGAGLQWIAKFSRGAGVRQSTLPQEVIEAQERVQLTVDRVVYAIANHQFEKARLYSDEERRERENLRLVREKYGIYE